jgi:hypothetical protein
MEILSRKFPPKVIMIIMIINTSLLVSKCKNRGRPDRKEEREECSSNVALQAGQE